MASSRLKLGGGEKKKKKKKAKRKKTGTFIETYQTHYVDTYLPAYC
jgi:hypothetical protein